MGAGVRNVRIIMGNTVGAELSIDPSNNDPVLTIKGRIKARGYDIVPTDLTSIRALALANGASTPACDTFYNTVGNESNSQPLAYGPAMVLAKGWDAGPFRWSCPIASSSVRRLPPRPMPGATWACGCAGLMCEIRYGGVSYPSSWASGARSRCRNWRRRQPSAGP